ncbi:hypothetical protein L3V83_01005 [Thiotrichales bacterium 19X7-9]|nr:hypothetical protein [Thiotrichales bacterium 19X7-9]
MKKAIGRVTFVFLGILVALFLFVVILGSLFTWRMTHYDDELSAYLSDKLNSKIQLDLTDVSWQGINPVLTFKTIQISQKSADFSSQLKGLSVKISLLKSILSWHIAPESVQIDKLAINIYFNKKSKTNHYDFTSKEATEDWQAVQRTTQATLTQILSYIDGVQPEVIVKALKLNLFGKDNKQIALMGNISIRHRGSGGYYFKGQIDTALKNSHFDFDFEIGHSNNQAYLEGYFDIATLDLQKAISFLGLDMFNVRGKNLSASGYINFQPNSKSHLAIRFQGNDLLIKNIKRKSKLMLNRLIMDVGGQYDSNGQFKFQIVPHELIINHHKRLLKQLEIQYQLNEKYPWQMRLYYGQLGVLSDIRNIIPEKMILSTMRPFVESGELSGRINQLEIKRSNLFDLDTPFILDADFSNISYLNHQLKLNLLGIDGDVHVTNTSGKLDITAKSLQVKQSIIGMQDFPEASGKTNIAWQVNHDQLDVNIGSLIIAGQWFKVDAKGQIVWNFKDKLPTLDLTANAYGHDITQAKVRGFLPKTHMTPKLHQWLYENIYAAKEVDASLRLKGNLSDFPYVDGNGIFKLIAKAKDAQLTPWEGWPLITNADGKLDFDQGRFRVSASSGQTLGVQLLPSDLTIGDIRPHIVSEMLINIHTKTNSEDAKNYIIHSPLYDNAKVWFDWMQYQGDIESTVKMSVPLGNQKPMHVDGQLSLSKGQFGLKLFPSMINIYNASGQIKFNDDYATKLSVNGWLGLNAPFSIDYTQIPKGHFKVTSKATLTDSMSLPEVIRSKLKGQSEVNFTANWQDAGGQIKFNSLFNGLSFQLPEPLTKEQQKINFPTDVKFSWQNHHNQLTSFNIDAKLNDQLSLSSEFSFSSKVFKLFAKLNRLDMSGWFDLIQSLDKQNIQPSKFNFLAPFSISDHEVKNKKIASTLLQSPLTIDQRLTNLIKGFQPKIGMQINQLSGFGQVFDQVVITSKTKKSAWFMTVNSDKTKDNINLTLTVPFEQNYWQLSINDLQLSTIKDIDFTSDNSTVIDYFPWWMPSIDLLINRFNYQKVDLLKKSNLILKRQANILDIPYYLFKGDHIFLLGTANWDGATNKTQVNGSTTSDNWGAFFNSIGFDDILVGGQGPVVFDVSFIGGLDPKLETLNGKLMFGINKGQFPQLKPGLSKLLGIFSLEAMLDRLGSGVNDLGKEGLYFNRIYGKYLIENGVMKTTQDILVDTPSFDMQISGEINFVKQTIDQSIIVQPHFSGTMAVAASLIGGPIAGLATYVADKLAGASILKNQGVAKITVKGPWDKPLINGK